MEGEASARPVRATEGPFAGWWSWSARDPFERLIGPFYVSDDADGPLRCGFVVEDKHLNGMGALHGGCMLSFADFCLFAISREARGGFRGRGVTVGLSGDFLGPAHAGDRVEATGEVTRGGGSLTFVRGIATAEGRPMLSFSGVIKAVKVRALEASPPPPAG